MTPAVLRMNDTSQIEMRTVDQWPEHWVKRWDLIFVKFGYVDMIEKGWRGAVPEGERGVYSGIGIMNDF